MLDTYYTDIVIGETGTRPVAGSSLIAFMHYLLAYKKLADGCQLLVARRTEFALTD